MSLPLQAVDRLFARLQATYGRDFISMFEGIEIGLVKSSWAHELSGFAGDLPAIAWALENLPERCPNVIAFRNICRRSPTPDVPRIEYSQAGKERIDAELAKLGKSLPPRGSRVDARDWAHRILAEIAAGGKRSMTVAKMARDAVGAA